MQVVVDLDVSLEHAEDHANRVIAALKADGVLGEPKTLERMVGNPFDGTAKQVRDKVVWPPGPRVFDALDVRVLKVTKSGVRVEKDGVTRTVFDFRKQDPNHVEVDVGWALHCADHAEFRCPHCDAKQRAPWDDGEGTSIVDAIEAARAGAAPELRCPACRKRVGLNEMRAEPPAAFGALAFRFINWWPLRAALVGRIQESAGSRVALVVV
jgi:hypothetical protein